MFLHLPATNSLIFSLTNIPRNFGGLTQLSYPQNLPLARVEIRKSQSPFHAGNGKWAGVIDNGCGHMVEIISDELQSLGTYIEYNKTLTALTSSETKGVVGKSIDVLHFADGNDVKIGSQDTVIFTIPITAVCKFLELSMTFGIGALKLLHMLSIMRSSYRKIMIGYALTIKTSLCID